MIRARTVSNRKKKIIDEPEEKVVGQSEESNETSKKKRSGRRAKKPAVPKSGDEEILELTDSYIRDDKGNIELHTANVTERMCEWNAGDYLPGNTACDAPCPMRAICAVNAVSFDRITIDDNFHNKMKQEATIKFGEEMKKFKNKKHKKKKGFLKIKKNVSKI